MSEFNPKRTDVVEPLGSTRTPWRPVECQCVAALHQHPAGEICREEVFKDNLCRVCWHAVWGSTSSGDE